VGNSGHYIQLDQPSSVIEAILQVVHDVSSTRRADAPSQETPTK